MATFHRMRAVLRRLLQRGIREHELDAELRSHLDLLSDEHLARGLPPEEARRAARLELGGLEQVKEQVRSARFGYYFENLARDLRFGARMLLKNPGFSLLLALILALAIGANAAVYSIARAIFLQPLPQVAQISRLVTLRETLPDGSCCQVPPANFLDLRKEDRFFSRLAAYAWKPTTSMVDSIPRPLSAVEVSQDFFTLFGGSPSLGRGFLDEEFLPGHRVVVVSHEFWRTRLSEESGSIGRSLRLNGADHTVVGVMPAGFDFPPSTDLWIPMAYDANGWGSRSPGRLHVVGQLQGGVDIPQAQGAMDVLARRLEREYPQAAGHSDIRVESLRQRVNGNLTPLFTLTLLGASIFFLLLTCANVANLQLARAAAREQELRVRASLGAGRARIFQQLLIENLLLLFLGAVLGVLVGKVGVRLLIAGMPAGTARELTGWSNLALDGPVLLFTLALTLVTGLLSGLAPMWKGSQPGSGNPLGNAGSRTTQSRRQRRLRDTLVALQISLAVVLLVGAALMIKGFHALSQSSEGFEPSSLLTLHVVLPDTRYRTQRQRAAYLDQALEKLSSLPGVSSACAFSAPPLSNNGVTWWEYRVPGQADSSRPFGAILQNISPGYFQTLRIRLLRGREFTPQDLEGSLPVAIVSESLARRRWPGKSAMGEQIRLGQPDSAGPWLTVIGVARDVEFDWTDNAPEPAIYLPYGQSASAYSYLALRSDSGASSLANTVRRELADLDPDLPLYDVETLGVAMNGSFGGLLEIGGTLVILGLIGMVIAVMGVYAVMAYSVWQRTHEIGIRMALGASPRSVLTMIFRQGAALTLVALALGLLGALALTRLVSGFFFGVSPTDPQVFAGIVLLLASAALLACWLPARRAMRVQPLVALRYE